MTTFIIVWRVVTPVGPRREATRCRTWQAAEQFIATAERTGAAIVDVVFA